ncbi:vomeronasal type-1 receptor 4-like [Suricata suricatta]|uniref:Vomeronasal type-1 receptor n=1 Tax=Suricata suricatta TaxID=37032 RepID=A0A673UXN0_SURSU|nr:vomeronasal type-1 receptor 4-like [Suricata suricatta]
MASCEFVMGIFFLFQTGTGLLGNPLLICFYILTLFTKHTWRPIDLILNQLALANFLVLFSKGIPQTLAAFCLDNFLGEALCKIIFYTHRVARGVSLCTTCLLSGFQTITISLNNPRWALKLRAPKFVQLSCCLCWILHLLINIVVPVKVAHPGNTRNITNKEFGLCSGKGFNSFINSLCGFLFTFLDILCLGPMGWASVSIVLFLQRHKQRVQYLHRISLSPRASPETTATYTVLLLVILFVPFYFLSSILSLCMTCFVNPSLHLVNICTFFSACFPALSPYVLISREIQVFRIYFASCKTRISK